MREHFTSRFFKPAGTSLILLLVAIALSGSALAYDANIDFVANSLNPNGVWRYGYTTTLGGAFNLFGEYVSGAQGYAWRTNLAAGAPNYSHFTLPGFGALAGETELHGGPNGEFAILRFTTPNTGNYDLLATWRGPGDVGNTDLYLLKNSNGGSPLASTASTTLSGTFQFSNVPLNAGDTIDLALGNGGDSFTFDGTPLNLQITAVPEPSAGVLLVLGVSTCLLRPYRKGNTCSHPEHSR